jgi:hypothetical protein
MAGRNQHIVPHKRGWAVRSENAQRASSVRKKLDDAVEVAREIAGRQRSDIFVWDGEGNVIWRDSFKDGESAVVRAEKLANTESAADRLDAIKRGEFDYTLTPYETLSVFDTIRLYEYLDDPPPPTPTLIEAAQRYLSRAGRCG